jgi:hypothetical protein
MLPQKLGWPKSAAVIPAKIGGKNCIPWFFLHDGRRALPRRGQFCYGAVNIPF